ncbi:MAG: EamA family transporter [Halanaeroarchaeum sp.]
MALLEIAAALALLASVCSGLQAIAVEYGLGSADLGEERSGALAAAVVSVVVGVAVFWTLLAIRGAIPRVPSLARLAPFAVAGLANPAAFRLLYFGSIDRVGARISSAVVSANPALAALLAVPLLGEDVTLVSGVGLLCIVAGGVILQVTGTSAGASSDMFVTELSNATPRDLLAPVASMALLAGSFVMVKIGLEGYPHALVGTAVGQTSALLAFLALFAASARTRRRVLVRDRTALGAFVLAGAFVAVNWLAWFSALQIGSVVTIVPLSNLYPLVVLVVSYALARQIPRSPRVVAGVTAIVAGASLMQLA